MLDSVEARAIGEHPAGKDPLIRLVDVDLVDLGEHVGLRRLGRGAGIADAGGNLQRAELNGFVGRDLKRNDAPGDLVEAGEDRRWMLDLVRARRRQGENPYRASQR